MWSRRPKRFQTNYHSGGPLQTFGEMEKVVSNYQHAFVVGRKILDAFLRANEP